MTDAPKMAHPIQDTNQVPMSAHTSWAMAMPTTPRVKLMIAMTAAPIEMIQPSGVVKGIGNRMMTQAAINVIQVGLTSDVSTGLTAVSFMYSTPPE